MAKLTLTDITSGYGLTTTINANNTLIETALENTLSRDGTAPNTMGATLDMNSNRITNLPTAVNNSEPITLGQAATIAGVTNPLDQDSVAAVLWPQTAAELAAGVTPAELQYPPGNVLRYGAVRDSATDDSSAFDDAIAQAKQTNGEEVYVPPGDYHITSTITVSNCRDVSIRGTFGSTLQWNGATTSPCLQIGAAGVSTFGITINGLSIEDETAGTGNLTDTGLMFVDNCKRSRFYNVYLYASSEFSQGTGLMLRQSWILDFYGLRVNNLNNGIAFGDNSEGVLATNFYGAQVENFSNAGFIFDSTAGYATRINLNGCTIENGELSGTAGTGNGIEITGSSIELNITACYFEKNNYDIYISASTGVAQHNIGVRDCWFKAGSAAGTDAHIWHAGNSALLTVQDSTFVDRDGVTMEHASAYYQGFNNAVQSVVEVSASSTHGDGTSEGDFVYITDMLATGGQQITTPVLTLNGNFNTPAKTLADSTTPSVAGSNVFLTGTQSAPLTNFTDGEDGQIITLIGSGACTLDVTSTSLRGGTVDIVMAAGDVVQFVRAEAAGVWRLIGFMDTSVDNSGGA